MRISLVLIAGVIVILVSCNQDRSSGETSGEHLPAPNPGNPAEVTLIMAELDALQSRSIGENREYCGYLGITSAGEYAISPAKRGSNDGCMSDSPPDDLRVIASYHTHAAYSYDYDSEVPSVDDVEGDIYEEVNGYLSTPGGRVWFIDYRAQKAIMLCDTYCITADPSFRIDPELTVHTEYTLDALRKQQY